MNRINYSRDEEKTYHNNCYTNNTLFAPGSWLHQPVQTVSDLLPKLQLSDYPQALDLGCGVGRNTIPIAQYLKPKLGKVIGVDLLESAISRLHEYSNQYSVRECIEGIQSDIESYSIGKYKFDFIVAVSALEHLSSERALELKLQEMAAGTKVNGINCIILNSNILEVVAGTTDQLSPMFELNFPTERMLAILEHHYSGWEILRKQIKSLTFDIERQNIPVTLTSDCITYVVRRLQ
ncbi:class I SAM-dependent methyltransferase [Paenibacillus sp. L3-i20]|uniref:class I SAM-dependent methyltransferase n=1 Tax=Paenibacillus sp. L3-i20 TaxID=2905833 RepID=UPI001EDCFE7E|nr:class I SAM-dependent methyltransferase [Paenibacillus sp. L3-i20]GKU79164.1 methyltransferase [Paenibacillus sp. L3-i20]